MSRRRPLTFGCWAASLALALLVLAAVVGVALVAPPRGPGGDAPSLSAERAWAALAGDGDDTARAIVWGARLPRVLLAALVGAALAQSGALLQVLLRNPLADPFVLGVSSGAALAAVAALALGLVASAAGHATAGACGAALTALVVQRLARDRDGRLSTMRLVLGGVVLSYLLSAGVMWVLSLASAQEGQRYLFWLMGSLASASGRDVLVLAAAVGAGSALAALALPALNLLVLSDEHAADAGVGVERVKWTCFGAAALLTGASVALAGSIGFVGLVVPHAVRLVAGGDARLGVPLSALSGAAFLVAADFAARALGEVPLGVITATLGGPAFLLLLARQRSS